MTTINFSDLRVYVGTYAKYNNGSLYGAWLDLADYSNKDEFYQACHELHKDESDPEFMFQDWENIPASLISECSISDKIFDLIAAGSDLSDTEQDAFLNWVEWRGVNLEKEDIDSVINDFRDSFQGEYDSEIDFAEYIVEECYDLPEIARTYFDYKAFARDLFMCDYYYDGFYVFSAC